MQGADIWGSLYWIGSVLLVEPNLAEGLILLTLKNIFFSFHKYIRSKFEGIHGYRVSESKPTYVLSPGEGVMS